MNNSKLKLLELFGGIGACTAALKKLGIDFEVADYVEIDKYAVASYKAVKVNSKTQLYKQAGNSIVVNVLECIFKNLF